MWLDGLMIALSPENLLWLVIGSSFGLLIGVLPAIGANLGVALVLPVHLRHGADVGHHHALRHPCRRQLWRLGGVDPAEHAGRPGHGGHLLGRLPHVAAGTGRPGAGHRHLRLLFRWSHRLHRPHRPGAAAHGAGAAHRVARVLCPGHHGPVTDQRGLQGRDAQGHHDGLPGAGALLRRERPGLRAGGPLRLRPAHPGGGHPHRGLDAGDLCHRPGDRAAGRGGIHRR